MIVVGIDPGKSGGVAVISVERGQPSRLVSTQRMPLLKQGKRDLVDPLQLERGLSPCVLSDIDVIVIENVHSMPKQGVASSFNFGRHVGVVEGWAIGTGKPSHWVTPNSWKKFYGLSSDKRASLDAARMMFGDSPLWGVLANDGIAEAALIGLYWTTKLGKPH